MGNQSDEPDTGLTEGFMAGLAFKQAYDENMKAGFTERQALYIVMAQVTGNPGIAPGAAAPDPPEVPNT